MKQHAVDIFIDSTIFPYSLSETPEFSTIGKTLVLGFVDLDVKYCFIICHLKV